MAVPYPAITKIPNTDPAAVPDLWNATYVQIDANFAQLDTRLGSLETGAVRTLADLSITVTAAAINHLSGITGNVQSQLNGKFATPAGTTAQYVSGNGTLATFPTTWDWANVANKPTTFAASGMSLAVGDVPTLNQNTTGSAAKLTTARSLTIGGTAKSFDGSAAVAWTLAEIGASAIGHGHAIGDITGLQTALDSKATGAHNHTLNSLSNVVISNIAVGHMLGWSGAAWVNMSAAEAGFAAAVHTHTIANVTGLQTALDGKLAASGTAVAATALATARNLTVGSTTRSFDGTGNLSWTLGDIGAAAASHTHTIANVTGLQTALDGKSATGHSHAMETLSNVSVSNISTNSLLQWNGTAWVNKALGELGYALTAHSHVVADVTGLQAALDGKLASGGTAVAATALATARSLTIGSTGKSFNGTANVTWTLAEIGAAAASHTHTIANVTGLQTALDGKSATSHSHTLDSLSNVTISANANGEILRWSGTQWINNTLAEAGIAAASHTHTIAEVSGLQGALDGKLAAGATAVAASRWASARTITIGSTSKALDGSADASWSLAEIGAAGRGANTFSGVQTATGFTVSSSRSLKHAINPLDVGADAIDLLQPVTFRYNSAPEVEVAGLILEETAEVFPLACNGAGIDYGQLVPLLIATIQHDRSRLRDAIARIETLEAKAA